MKLFKTNLYKKDHEVLKILFGSILAILSLTVSAQTQVVKGSILDATAEYPLIGATVTLVGSDPIIGSVTDIEGNFRIENVPAGRHTFLIQYVGYKSATLPNVLVTAGKEVVLPIKLEESVESLNAVVVTAEAEKDLPINDLAKVSARTFSLEEVTRFSGGRNDVARLAISFAGVSAPNDSRNDIVVRGNSPNGLLWRVEGLPISTTNHFATLGTTGGPVSALNTNLLRTSDFLTGAFPAEYGNSNAAVFDVNFRSGNLDKFEFTGQMSAFSGLEFMAEGPISRANNSSFVASYRYGIASLAATGTSAIPYYQDFSFKVNLGQSRFGTFEVFGMGGLSSIDFYGDEIDENDLFADPNVDAFVNNDLGLGGVTHKISINKNNFLKTTAGVSTNSNTYYQDNFIRNANDDVTDKYRATEVENREIRYTLTSTLNSKFNARWSLRSGFLTELYTPSFITQDRDDDEFIPDNNGDEIPDFFNPVTDMTETYLLSQLYSQAEYKFTDDLKATFGIHGQHLSINNDFIAEPRAAISWQFTDLQRLSFAYGLHSQIAPAPVIFYEERMADGTFEKTNEELDFIKAHHLVAGYDLNFARDWRLKTELYYQALYDVPVESQSSSYSVLNEGADFVFDQRGSLVNDGVGRNIGMELTVEKFFSRGYYALITGSLYESTYEGSDGVERSTAFNSNGVFNILAGKEWKFGSSDQNAFTFDTKLTGSGGAPYTPIDLQESISQNRQILFENQAFSERYEAYFRWDVKFGVRLNSTKRSVSHQFFVDLQNVTNRENEFVQRYNSITNEINGVNQIGFFPDVMYRIQF